MKKATRREIASYVGLGEINLLSRVCDLEVGGRRPSGRLMTRLKYVASERKLDASWDKGLKKSTLTVDDNMIVKYQMQINRLIA